MKRWVLVTPNSVTDETRNQGAQSAPATQPFFRRCNMSRTNKAEDSPEEKIGMSPEEEKAYQEESGSQGEPGDGAVGDMTDSQGRAPATDN